MPKSILERIRLMNGKMGGRLPLGAIRFTMLATIFSMVPGFTEPIPAVFASDLSERPASFRRKPESRLHEVFRTMVFAVET